MASRSTCPRASVGAVIVAGDRVISTGYNGAPRGLPHCTDAGCVIKITPSFHYGLEEHTSCIRTLHAEVNAILNWYRQVRYHDLIPLSMYITHEPCENCIKLCIASGIKDMVYFTPYGGRSHDFIRELKAEGIINVYAATEGQDT